MKNSWPRTSLEFFGICCLVLEDKSTWLLWWVSVIESVSFEEYHKCFVWKCVVAIIYIQIVGNLIVMCSHRFQLRIFPIDTCSSRKKLNYSFERTQQQFANLYLYIEMKKINTDHERWYKHAGDQENRAVFNETHSSHKSSHHQKEQEIKSESCFRLHLLDHLSHSLASSHRPHESTPHGLLIVVFLWYVIGLVLVLAIVQRARQHAQSRARTLAKTSIAQSPERVLASSTTQHAEHCLPVLVIARRAPAGVFYVQGGQDFGKNLQSPLDILYTPNLISVY